MPLYAVVSPPWSEYTFALDDGTGPTEDVCEYLEVEAPTAKEAKVIALRAWRIKHKPYGYLRWCFDDENPFRGVKAYDVKKLEGA